MLEQTDLGEIVKVITEAGEAEGHTLWTYVGFKDDNPNLRLMRGTIEKNGISQFSTFLN